jgi:glucose-6-phosphate isomerase
MFPEDLIDRLGPLRACAESVRAELVRRNAVGRMWDGDHTLWRDDPTEVADRLGWLHVVGEVRADLDELRRRCDRLASEVDHVLLMGMGGSSLFADVLARTFGSGPGRPNLVVLDSTHPTAVDRAGRTCPPERTLHLAASKSGTTIETRSHLEWAWRRTGGDGAFAVVTDPGSELAALAADRHFGDVFENRPDIGGRYSALSLFGIVPALLAGIDVDALLDGAAEALTDCGPDAHADANPGLALASAMAAGARSGRDKLTVALPPRAEGFGAWLEQLVAESLGKDGTGLVPVVGEALGAPPVYGEDRLFLIADDRAALRALAGAGHPAVATEGPVDERLLGRAVVVWEVATALAGAALGVNPFDQPAVEAAKAAARAALAGTAEPPAFDRLEDLLVQLRPGDHLALCAFVDPGDPVVGDLARAREVLRDRYRVATSMGIGPRYLHSSGQLHKGGPAGILVVQVLDAACDDDGAARFGGHDGGDLDIPSGGATSGSLAGFGRLLAAQADGDLVALRAAGRRAGRVPLAELSEVAR